VQVHNVAPGFRTDAIWTRDQAPTTRADGPGGRVVGELCVPIGDNGVTYTFTNRCGEDIVVERATGSVAFRLADGERATIGTLDEEPHGGFVIRRPDGTGELTMFSEAATFEVSGNNCPAR